MALLKSFVLPFLVGACLAAPSPPVPLEGNFRAPKFRTLSANASQIAVGEVLHKITPKIDNIKLFEQFILAPPVIFPTCQTAIDAKARQKKINLGTPTSGFITDSGMGTIHKNYQWGAVYCRDVNQGAHAVYGNIWLKFKDTPNSGYPIIDESGTTDKNGQHVRYSVFSQGNAIYWTGGTGAHFIRGDIHKQWLAIGGAQSDLGFPVTDELASGTHGGLYNDFSNGMIYWQNGRTFVHVGGLPDTLVFDWNNIHMGDVSGSTTVTISSNGEARWKSHMHISAPYPMDWSVAYVIMNADGTSLSLSKHATVGPNLDFFGANDSDMNQPTNNAEISQNWRAFVAMTQWRARADTSFAFVKLVEDLYDAIKTIYPYAAAVITILA